MKIEIWKDVIGYEGLYQVSNFGQVKALPRIKIAKGSYWTSEKILKPGSDDGYQKVVLTKNGIRSTKKVHRLVASAFYGEYKELSVNHIDSNRANNRIENLEWVTHLENIRHARKNNRYPKTVISEYQKQKIKDSTCKKVICTESGMIYNSIKEASEDRNIKKSTLVHYLLGSRKNKTTLKLF
jgi:hypothetical protein